MRVKCPGCSKNINIKNGSFPLDKAFSFLCPGCSFKIRIKPAKNVKAVSDQKMYGEKFEKQIIEKNAYLPSIPAVLEKTKKVFNDKNHNSRDLSRVICLDQAISARVLKLANSAYFNFNPPVPTIEDACVLLGEDNLLSIILVAEMSKMMDEELKGYDISSGSLFLHCIAVAAASKIISKEKMPLFEQDSFSAGLLHDCGKLVLNRYVKKKKKEFLNLCKDKNKTCFQAEKILFGFSHEEIGYRLLESWKLPGIQTHAIGFHHNPINSGGNELAYILRAADYTAINAGFSASIHCSGKKNIIDGQVLDFLDIKAFELDDYKDRVKLEVKEMTKDLFL